MGNLSQKKNGHPAWGRRQMASINDAYHYTYSSTLSPIVQPPFPALTAFRALVNRLAWWGKLVPELVCQEGTR